MTHEVTILDQGEIIYREMAEIKEAKDFNPVIGKVFDNFQNEHPGKSLFDESVYLKIRSI